MRELGRVRIPGHEPGDHLLRLGGVVLVCPVDLGEPDAGQHGPVPRRRWIRVEQTLEHGRLVVDRDRAPARHGAAGQSGAENRAERLDDGFQQRAEEAPRAQEGEQQRDEPPLHMPLADRYDDERQPDHHRRGAQHPAYHRTHTRRICEVHEQQVDRARPTAQPTHASFNRSVSVADLLSRREFLASAAVGVAAAQARDIPFPMRPPRPLPPRSRWAAKPVAGSSANGLRAVQKAFDMLMQGADTLDAVIEGVKIQELDPSDDSVGYGGLPNAAGVVQLDASCMPGSYRPAWALGALEW